MFKFSDCAIDRTNGVVDSRYVLFWPPVAHRCRRLDAAIEVFSKFWIKRQQWRSLIGPSEKFGMSCERRRVTSFEVQFFQGFQRSLLVVHLVMPNV